MSRDEREWTCLLSDRKPNRKGCTYIRARGKVWRETRWVWTQHRGPIPDGYDIHHTCERRNCVRLEHLKLVRHDRHKPDYHAALTPENVREIRQRYVRGSNGKRPGTGPRLAAEFGITTDMVRRVARGEKYAWVS